MCVGCGGVRPSSKPTRVGCEWRFNGKKKKQKKRKASGNHSRGGVIEKRVNGIN